ncbi:SMI1/KNR4 family protein [Parvicella tangerina]|uniref:Knr4/Smi1-like domain-containing protein n=1 Tax=Parvicella tangerina TaxID=2829795 RepID=A0A916JN00_9FLAO|nr:SMI1/KNR4 family protein [Parvicella tangerina]CAG5081991.1 hypothetical protein CRYO30217_01780 [Parvicella tangerina]
MITFSEPHNSPITASEYDEFIQHFKLDLPDLYRQIMLTSNGGFPEKPCFGETSIYFTPIKHEDFNMYQLFEASGIDYLAMGLYPFCDGDGDISYCIGLDSEKHQKIYSIDETAVYQLVAESLEDFIDQLEEEENDQTDTLVTSNAFKKKKPYLKRLFERLFRS